MIPCPIKKLGFVILLSITGVAVQAATFSVINTNDSGAGSLRQAMTDANASGTNDVIDIQVSGTISPASPLPLINKGTGGTNDLILQNSSGGTVTVNGGNARRIFFVQSGDITFQGMTLSNGRASGGSGSTGSGGGGMGAGAAIFIHDNSNVIVEDVIFASNAAVGGNGGTGSDNEGGSGGGMGGNGFNGFANDLAGSGGSGGGGLGGDGSFGETRALFNSSRGGGGGGTVADGVRGNLGGTGGVSGGGQGGEGPDNALNGSDGGFGGGGGGGFGEEPGLSNTGAGGDGGFGGGGGSAGNNGQTPSTIRANGNGGYGGGGAGLLGAAGGGGDGGFGGGGAGDNISVGSGGFGGGNGGLTAAGTNSGAGGGGAGFGGTIFLTNTGTATAGTLTIRGNTSISGSSVTGGSGGTGAGSGAALGEAIFLTSGTGLTFDVQNSAETTTIANSIQTQGGDTGIVKNGAGTLVLSSANTGPASTGNTFVGAIALNGGTLSVGTDVDNLPQNANALNFNTSSAGTETLLLTTANPTGTNNAINRNINTGIINNNAVIDVQSSTAAFEQPAARVVSGAGNLQKSGLGALNIRGANTFTGNMVIEEGTLNFASDGNLGVSNNVEFTNGAGLSAELAFDQGATPNLDHNIVLNNVGTATISATSNSTLSFESGTPPVISGTGPLRLAPDSTSFVDLRGLTNTNTGGVTIDGAGTVRINDNLNLGAAGSALAMDTFSTLEILDNSVTIDRPITMNGFFGGRVSTAVASTLSGDITGTGGLTLVSGTLTLTGTNSYTGTTSVDGGNLIGDTDSLQGTIATGGTLTFDQSTSGTYAGSIAGTGPVVKTGTGTVTMTGTSVYVGDTNINQGTFAITTESGIGSSLSVVNFNGGTLRAINTMNFAKLGTTLGASGGTIEVDAGAVMTYDNVFSGVGDLTKTGAGELAFANNANTYTGATNINGGTLRIQSGNEVSASSVINVDGGTLAATNSVTVATDINVGASNGGVSNSSDFVHSGDLTGAGTFTKSGAGDMNLTGGANTHSGSTVVSAGTLRVNGNGLPNSAGVTVDSGGTLGGVGPIGGPLVDNGNVAPGNSIGTLVVNSNFSVGAGGTLTIEVDTTPSSDLVDVSGTTTIDATAQLVLVDIGNPMVMYQIGQSFTFIESDGAISGTFTAGNFTSIFRCFGVIPEVVAGSPNIYRFVLTVVPFTDMIPASTPNVGPVAEVLSAVIPSGDIADVLLVLTNSPNTAALFNNLNRLQPAWMNTAAMVSGRNTALINNAIDRHNRDNCMRHEGEHRRRIWGHVFGEHMDEEGQDIYFGHRAVSTGVVVGADKEFLGSESETKLTGGIAGSYFFNYIDWSNQAGNGHIHQYNATLYGHAQWRDWYMDVSGTVGRAEYDLRRNIEFLIIDRKAVHEHHGMTYAGHAGVGYRHDFEYATVGGHVKTTFAYAHESPYTERGADSLNLSVDSHDTSIFFNAVGVEACRTFKYGPLWYRASLHFDWLTRVQVGSNRMTAYLVGLPITVWTDDTIVHSYVPGVEVSMWRNDRFYLTGHFDLEVSNRNLGVNTGLRATLRY